MAKQSGASIMSIVKFILSILLLPVVVGTARSFFDQLFSLGSFYDVIICGMLTYLIVSLFVVPLKGIYQLMQKAFSDLFKGVPFLASHLPLVLPLLPTLLLIVLYVMASLFKVTVAEKPFLFFVGFTLAMHVILTARELQEGDPDTLKPQYFLSMTLVFVMNLVIIAALLDLNFARFSFVEFYNSSVNFVKDLYLLLYKRLFAV
jgi:hypothetical protein